MSPRPATLATFSRLRYPRVPVPNPPERDPIEHATMVFLRSLVFNAFFVLWTAFLGFLCTLLMFFSQRAIRGIGRFWARTTNLALRLICGIRTELRGLEHRPEGAAIVASKHQSAWDTFIFLALLPEPVYVLKAELFRIPLFGPPVRRMGHIGIDRAAGASAIKSLVRDSRAAMALERQVVIFPEGTRSAPGVEVRYHPGIAALYSQAGVAVTPVALNSGYFWGRQAFFKRPGTIVLEFLPPIPAGLDRKELLPRLKDAIEGATDALRPDGA